MRYLPIFFDTTSAQIAIAGGGEVALSKLKILLKTEAQIHVYASKVHDQIEQLAVEGRILLTRRKLSQADLSDTQIVYATYFNEELNREIRQMGKAAGAIVNVVDMPQHCDFISPAIVDRDPVVVAIGTEGAAPVLARKIKKQLEEDLQPQIGLMARVGKGFRGAVTALPFGRARRDFWDAYYKQSIDTEAGAQDALENLLAAHLSSPEAKGAVHLLGANSFDPELLSLKARKAIDKADLIIYDDTISDAILDLARKEATTLPIQTSAQCKLAFNALLLNEAKSGARVVRLISGDLDEVKLRALPVAQLQAEKITVEIIPGVSAGPLDMTQPTRQAVYPFNNKQPSYAFGPQLSEASYASAI